ncbi:hypothetical protein N9U66_00385 [Synechococcus sp. AH-736-M20]|nr:hypothetical protein [Synechococcus sp. AH-736-M20]
MNNDQQGAYQWGMKNKKCLWSSIGLLLLQRLRRPVNTAAMSEDGREGDTHNRLQKLREKKLRHILLAGKTNSYITYQMEKRNKRDVQALRNLSRKADRWGYKSSCHQEVHLCGETHRYEWTRATLERK